MSGKDGGSLQVVPEGLQPPGLGGFPRSCCALCMLMLHCTRRNEPYLYEAGCVKDVTRSSFRVAVIVPDHAANNFIVLVVPLAGLSSIQAHSLVSSFPPVIDILFG